MPRILNIWSVAGLSIALAFTSAGFSQNGTCSGMSLGQGANLNGFVPFPASSLWNTDISAAPVDPNSANIINFIGATVTLHPDFGAGTFQNQTIGIPYQTVAGTQAKVAVKLGTFANESGPGAEPIPPNAFVLGDPQTRNHGRQHPVPLKKPCCLCRLCDAGPEERNMCADR